MLIVLYGAYGSTYKFGSVYVYTDRLLKTMSGITSGSSE